MTQRIALITGGSRGLGRNTALQLAQRGVGIVLTYHSNHAAAAAVVAEIQQLGPKAVALQLDTGACASFADFAQQLRTALQKTWQQLHFNYLINNAGMGGYSSFENTTELHFDQLLAVHFKGVFFLTQQLLPMLRDGGRIINISSGLTRFSIPGSAAYACMKGAIEILTKYLAKELGSRGITANVVAPGAIATDFGGGKVRDDQQLNQFLASQTALGRVGQPGDIGGMIASLLDDSNCWVNAQRIEASGGMFI